MEMLLRLLPRAEAARRAARRSAVGWRAADAGDQPRADGAAQTAACWTSRSLGLSPLLTQQIFGIIRRINAEQGVAILLVEQNAHIALKTADYGYVLEVGRVVMEDDCHHLMQKDDIKEFYLGQKDAGVRGRRRWKKKKLWR